MREHPILFTGPMVRALIAGRKTQTRRLMKPQPTRASTGTWFWSPNKDVHHVGDDGMFQFVVSSMSCPHGAAGDRLWVKETFSAHGAFKDFGRKVYRADIADGREPHGLRWKPSIFCSRAASRLTLEITAVRVERLQDITEGAAIAEGIESIAHDTSGKSAWKNYLFKTAHPRKGVTVTDDFHRVIGFRDPRQSYRTLWESINGPGTWSLNPWVWVIEFKRVST